MKIKSLCLENFQGIQHAEFDFDGLSASIYGDNATGKTTVFNAVTWLLFDKASTGAKNFTPKTKGAGGDLHNLDHSAEASFIMPSGEIATFKKVYHEVWKKKRGSSTEEFDGHTVDHYIDGVPYSEKEYTNTLERYCGGAERMKMLTMPDYFAETMDWRKRREILLELCGDVTDADVIRSDDALMEIDIYLRKPGTGSQFYSVEEYVKIAENRKKDINKELADLPGRIDEHQRMIPDDTLSIEQIEAIITENTATRESLLKQRASLLTGNTAVSEARKRTAEAEAALASAKSAYAAQTGEANAQTVDEIGKLTMQLGEAKTKAAEERSRAKELRTDLERRTARLDAKRRECAEIKARFEADYNREQATVWNVADETCHMCGQRLPTDRIDAMKADFNQRRSERLMEITREGNAQVSEINQWGKGEKEALKSLEQQAEDAEKAASMADTEAAFIQPRLDALRAKLSQVPAFETTPEYFTLSGQITICRAAEREAAQNGALDTSEIDNKIRMLDTNLAELQRKKAQHEQATAQKQRIAELEAREKQLGEEYENLECGIHLCDEFTKAKVKMLTSRIDSKFKNVRFRLFQEQLNGGVKDDCEVLIPGDGGRMVPYTFANNAARINAGLEIIGVLADHWEMEMPVFIDNAESVTHLSRTWTQTIRLVVSEQDAQLRLALD